MYTQCITDTLFLHFLCCMWLETAALIQLVVLQKRTDKRLAVCGTHHHTDQWSWETCHYTVPLWINGSLINIPKQKKNALNYDWEEQNISGWKWKMDSPSSAYWNCDRYQWRVSKLKCKKTTITDKCPQQYYILTTRWTTTFTYTLDSSTATYQLHQIKDNKWSWRNHHSLVSTLRVYGFFCWMVCVNSKRALQL